MIVALSSSGSPAPSTGVGCWLMQSPGPIVPHALTLDTALTAIAGEIVRVSLRALSLQPGASYEDCYNSGIGSPMAESQSWDFMVLRFVESSGWRSLG